MNKLSITLLIASLLLGVGGWMQTLSLWSDFNSPGAVSGLLLIIGGVILNWINKSPIQSPSASNTTTTTNTTTTSSDGKA